MAMQDARGGSRGRSIWRIAGWGFGATLLLIPLVAGAPWTASDFVFAAVLIGAVGVAMEVAVRWSRDFSYRMGVAVALAAAFLTVWVNAAVGLVGDEGSAFNLLFLGVVMVALVGAGVARFQAAGTALAMLGAAVAQVAVALAGWSIDPRGALFSTGFAAIWLVAAALFWKASRKPPTVAPAT